VRAYEIVLHEEAWSALAAASNIEQRRLLAYMNELRADPFCLGDFRETDSKGRANEVQLVGEWLVTFWSDHAVREVRVVRLEKVED